MGDNFTILLAGAGGLAAPAVWSLCEAWQGPQQLTLRILDPDTVELSNLNRQIFFGPADVGRAKAPLLAAAAARLFPSDCIHLTGAQLALGPDNIAAELSGVDYLIDATDSVAAKFLINDYCVANGIPFCYGGVLGLAGQLLAYDPRASSAGCLRCLFGDLSEAELDAQTATCRQAGVLGPVVGLIGVLQAEAALRCALDPEPAEASALTRIDVEQLRQENSRIQSTADCPLGCGIGSKRVLDLREKRCPSTFLYTKLALEKLSANETLDVRFGSLESVRNVTLSAAEEGYRAVTAPREICRSVYRVLFQRAG